MNRFDLNSVSLDQQNANLCSTKWGVMSLLEDSKVEGDLVDIDYEIVHIIPARDEIKTCSVEFHSSTGGKATDGGVRGTTDVQGRPHDLG